jgi:hypothetical protein
MARLVEKWDNKRKVKKINNKKSSKYWRHKQKCMGKSGKKKRTMWNRLEMNLLNSYLHKSQENLTLLKRS